MLSIFIAMLPDSREGPSSLLWGLCLPLVLSHAHIAMGRGAAAVCDAYPPGSKVPKVQNSRCTAVGKGMGGKAATGMVAGSDQGRGVVRGAERSGWGWAGCSPRGRPRTQAR